MCCKHHYYRYSKKKEERKKKVKHVLLKNIKLWTAITGLKPFYYNYSCILNIQNKSQVSECSNSRMCVSTQVN